MEDDEKRLQACVLRDVMHRKIESNIVEKHRTFLYRIEAMTYA